MAYNFDKITRLGQGYFGEVWLARETGLDMQVALKEIPKHKIPNKNNVFQEPQLLYAAQHDNVVKIYETGQLEDESIYISMEYLPKGSLEEEAKGSYITLSRTKRLICDVLRGLAYLHKNGILHKDIKPGNILIGEKSEGKLSDFGLAMPSKVSAKKIGTKEYNHLRHLAPEVWEGEKYDELSDIYSAGMTLYRMVNGDSFLPNVNPANLGGEIVSGKYPDRSNHRFFITKPLKRIISKAINLDPKERYQSADAMRQAIEQLKINMNWSERKMQHGTEWVGAWNGKCYLLSMHKVGNRYNVVFKKGNSRKEARRVTKYCQDNLTKANAERVSKRILQDCVLGSIS